MWFRLIVTLAILGLAEYYSYLVFRSAIRTSGPAWRTGLTVLYICLSIIVWAGVIFLRQLGPGAVSQTLRSVYIAVAMGVLMGKVMILVIMLLDDIRRLGVWVTQLFYSGGTAASPEVARAGIPRSVFFTRVALLAGGAILAGFIAGMRNRYRYRVHRIRIEAEGLPASFRGMKIVQLSDIHAGSFDNPEAVAEGVRKAMDEKPDLILFTGDIVNNQSDELEAYTGVFSRLQAPMGVYSVLGNHDYGDYVRWDNAEAKAANLRRLIEMQEGMGWKLLMNEHVILNRGEDAIALIGVENWGSRAGFPKYGNMQQACAGLNEKKIPFKILMSHDPSHWDTQVIRDYTDVQLTLSGHTHGMQFGVEIPAFKWSPVQYVYKNWAGLYREGKQYLYVNRGFGFIGYPGRVGILPEITVIELV